MRHCTHVEWKNEAVLNTKDYNTALQPIVIPTQNKYDEKLVRAKI